MAKDRLGFNYTSDEERRIAELEAQLADARKALQYADVTLRMVRAVALFVLLVVCVFLIQKMEGVL